MGRFFSSTIWIRKPSEVRSSKIWFLNFLQFGIGLDHLFEVGFQFLELFQFLDAFLPQELFPCRLEIDDLFFRRQLTRFDLPSLRVRSFPPPLMMLELSPLPEPPISATLSGVLKYSEMPLQIAFGGRTQQPHQQKERHHRRHEVGIGDLPCTAVMATGHLLDALDDDGSFVFLSSWSRSIDWVMGDD